MNNIFFIGGSGYIGSHIKRYFKDAVFTSSDDFDLTNIEQIELFFKNKQIDMCVILASKISYNKELSYKKEPFLTNVEGFNNLLNVLSKKSDKIKLIYFSSMTVYDTEQGVCVDETSSLAPIHDYGLSKVWAESLIKYYKLPSLIIRIPGVYGGERKGGYIYNTIMKLQEDQDISIDTKELGFWETIHIDDMIYMFKKLLENYQFDSKIEIFNISYGEATDFIKTAYFIKESLHSKGNITIKKNYKDIFLNNKKLQRYITPKYGYYDRLKLYIKEVTQ